MTPYEEVGLTMAREAIRATLPWIYRKGWHSMFGWFAKHEESRAIKQVMDFASEYPESRLILVDAMPVDTTMMVNEADGKVEVHVPLRIVSTAPFVIRPVALNLSVMVWHYGTEAAYGTVSDRQLAGPQMESGHAHSELVHVFSRWSSSRVAAPGEAILVECAGSVRVHGPWPLASTKEIPFATSLFVKLSVRQ